MISMRGWKKLRRILTSFAHGIGIERRGEWSILFLNEQGRDEKVLRYINFTKQKFVKTRSNDWWCTTGGNVDLGIFNH